MNFLDINFLVQIFFKWGFNLFEEIEIIVFGVLKCIINQTGAMEGSFT